MFSRNVVNSHPTTLGHIPEDPILNQNSVKTSKTYIPPSSDENLGLVNYPTTVI